MIVHMCKLQIVVLDQHFERVLSGLKDLGYLHLELSLWERPRKKICSIECN